VSERLLRAREVAELLDVDVKTVTEWFRAGLIPGFRVGGRVLRFRESEIEAWLDASRGPNTMRGKEPAAPTTPRLAITGGEVR
jgi:excisionase family DNA binding protein